MRRAVFAGTILFMSGCGESAGVQPTPVAVECTFELSAQPVCSFKKGKHAFEVALATKRLADTEVALTRAKVVADDKQHVLSLSPDVSMTTGDIGIVSFADINFDNVPDLAISTSFGVANQYFDYWTYDPKNAKYHSLGNYPRLNANPADKTLTASVKLNAAHYETRKYFWDKGRLVRKP